ncbi:hypothetical protein D9M70_583090 [compost metagenome]
MFDTVGELLVLQQHEVHIEQGAEFRVGVVGPQFTQAVLHATDLIDHRLASRAQTLDLGLDLFDLDKIVRHVHAARRHDDSPPDGNAP